MAILPELFAEMNSCKYLLLRDMTEPDENSLRLVVEEASARGVPKPIKIGDIELGEGVPIRSTRESRFFEIIWHHYIAYSVRNESYTARDKYDEVDWGELVCGYSKSRFLDYVSQATFASAVHPGPFQHIRVVCQNHVIDIASTEIPRIERLRPSESLGR